MTRCRNCGQIRHLTQYCPSYGPWYPGPGKNRVDYKELEEEISRKVAADIMADHLVDDDEAAGPDLTKRRGSPEMEEAARRHACKGCGAVVGATCTVKGGGPAEKSHTSRYRQLERAQADGN
jgi:hypothetical protein